MDIYSATKKGDFDRVRYLIEVEDVDINAKNEFDAIPLFYACLCGHLELVKYLFDQGAILDPNTFEGERCYYAALTPDIVKTLRNYKAKPRAINRLSESLRSMLLESCPSTSVPASSASASLHDISFLVQGTRFNAHRFLLAARCPYLADQLQGRWKDKQEVTFPKRVLSPAAFEGLLLYLYTDSVNVQVEEAYCLLLLAKQCQLQKLEASLQAELSRTTTRRVIVLPSTPSPLAADLRSLANRIKSGVRDVYADVCFEVEKKMYYCHKSLLCSRSPYFRSLLTGGFKESTSDHIELQDFSSKVFELIIEFLYFNHVSDLTAETVFDLLDFSGLFMLPDLKRVCVDFMVHHITRRNVYRLIIASELHDSQRLRENCLQFVAERFEELKDTQNFLDFLTLEASYGSYHLFVDMFTRLKGATEEHLVHYGRTSDWLEYEQWWDTTLTSLRDQRQEEKRAKLRASAGKQEEEAEEKGKKTIM